MKLTVDGERNGTILMSSSENCSSPNQNRRKKEGKMAVVLEKGKTEYHVRKGSDVELSNGLKGKIVSEE